MKGPATGLSQQSGEAEGSLTVETHGRAGAALTTTGRVGTARRPGSGKQGQQVYARNQCVTPRKSSTGSNLADVGRVRCFPAGQAGGRDLLGWFYLLVWEAMGKVCGVPRAMLPGQSWTPPPTTGWRTNVESLPAPPFTVGQPGRRQVGPAVGSKVQGGEGAPMVVRVRESRTHGEGGQQVRSLGAGMPGGGR